MPTLRHYLDASIAIATMLTLGAIAGFLAFGVTDDRSAIAVTALVVFLLTGVILLFRAWMSPSSSVRPK
jgi:hypothetical protein